MVFFLAKEKRGIDCENEREKLEEDHEEEGEIVGEEKQKTGEQERLCKQQQKQQWKREKKRSRYWFYFPVSVRVSQETYKEVFSFCKKTNWSIIKFFNLIFYLLLLLFPSIFMRVCCLHFCPSSLLWSLCFLLWSLPLFCISKP